MSFPSFFTEIPPIVVHDRLAEFLGAADGGVIEYRYADAVKLARHSCPTVAGAFLLAQRALAALYPGELPERGDIQVSFRNAQESGVTGVMAADFYPYLNSGQGFGLMGGLLGAAQYEKLSDNPGPAIDGMRVQVFAHVVIIAFIIIGNVGYFTERRRRAKEAR